MTNTSTMTRQVTVPNTADPQLRLDLLINTAESLFTEWDPFDISVNGTNAAHWSNTHANNTYLRYRVSMAAWAGQTVTLQFQGVEDVNTPTQFLLDDLTLTPR